MTPEPVYALPDNEDDALALFAAMRATYGWAGTVMVRGDVEGEYGAPITDAEWELVRTSGFWRHIPDGFASYGNDVITDAVASLLLNYTENDR
jgi:hypothetical protein